VSEISDLTKTNQPSFVHNLKAHLNNAHIQEHELQNTRLKRHTNTMKTTRH